MNYTNVKCQICNKEFSVMTWKLGQNRGKVCSIACRQELQKKSVSGIANQRWKGGAFIRDGYKFIMAKNHPYKNNFGYVREHRLIMEKHLGRKLTSEDIVHHINGVKTDNRIENLQIMSRLAHAKLHNLGLK